MFEEEETSASLVGGPQVTTKATIIGSGKEKSCTICLAMVLVAAGLSAVGDDGVVSGDLQARWRRCLEKNHVGEGGGSGNEKEQLLFHQGFDKDVVFVLVNFVLSGGWFRLKWV